MPRRAPRGNTFDPFVCCGLAADRQYGRPKGTPVCRECARLMEIGRAALKADAGAGRGCYIWSGRPYYSVDYPVRDSGGLEDAMADLVNRLAEPRGAVPCGEHGLQHVLEAPFAPGVYRGRYEIEEFVVSMRRADRDALNALDAAIRACLSKCAQDGKAEGRSIIMALAAGELTLADFERQAAAGGQRGGEDGDDD